MTYQLKFAQDRGLLFDMKEIWKLKSWLKETQLYQGSRMALLHVSWFNLYDNKMALIQSQTGVKRVGCLVVREEN